MLFVSISFWKNFTFLLPFLLFVASPRFISNPSSEYSKETVIRSMWDWKGFFSKLQNIMNRDAAKYEKIEVGAGVYHDP